MTGPYRARIVLSTANATLARAYRLLELAGNHPEDEALLVTSAVAFQVAALAQGLESQLRFHGEARADDSGVPFTRVPHALVLASPLTAQLFEATRLLLARELDPRNMHVRALVQLVKHRNAIMHVSERPQTLDIDPSQIHAVTGDSGERRTQIVLTVELPQEATPKASLQVGRAYQAAVRIFLGIVVDRDHAGPETILR